jgi:YHS domain-containing protein
LQVLTRRLKIVQNKIAVLRPELRTRELRNRWNSVCPVRGEKVDKDIQTVEYNGKYYGFCCGGCDEKFKKDPGKYSKNLSDDGKKFLGKNS